MIHGRLLPNSHPVAPNAKLKLTREPPFITGHHHAKCFAQFVVMHRIVRFSQVQLMMMSIPAKEILIPGKLREGEIPFLVVGRRWFAPHFVSTDQHLYLLNSSSFTLAVILIFRYWSGNLPSLIWWLFTSGIRNIVLSYRVVLATLWQWCPIQQP